jgi:ABC-type transporter lipoprotein component MlaA
MRDAVGDLSTMLISPMPLVGSAATGAVEYSDNQNTYQSISEGALDPYIAEREAYEQNRRYEVKNGEAPIIDLDDKPSR